jgi:hypothetical protein
MTKQMKKISNRKFFSGIKKDELINYFRNKFSISKFREILLFDRTIYSELFQHFHIEEALINESDIYIVLEQKLKDTSWHKLLILIEKTIPKDRLIKILTGIMP